MADRVVYGRSSARILIVSDAIVVLTEVVCYVQSGYCAPRKELLSHARIVNLMHYYVEVVDLCKGGRLVDVETALENGADINQVSHGGYLGQLVAQDS